MMGAFAKDLVPSPSRGAYCAAAGSVGTMFSTSFAEG